LAPVHLEFSLERTSSRERHVNVRLVPEVANEDALVDVGLFLVLLHRKRVVGFQEDRVGGLAVVEVDGKKRHAVGRGLKMGQKSAKNLNLNPVNERLCYLIVEPGKSWHF
jgi:hypothetical protein